MIKYGQVAYYEGTIANHLYSFILDDHHTFYTGKPMLVCGNTADMISKTHYVPHFTLMGNKATHFGSFDACNLTIGNNMISGGCC